MKLLGLLMVALFVVAASGKQCATFDRLMDYDPTAPLPPGYSETGIPGVILNEHNKVVRIDSEPGQPANFAHLQGVSNSYYGSPLCVLIIDCGAANAEHITAAVTNVNRNDTPVQFNLEALCSQDGLFFGCVDTSFVPASGWAMDENVVVGEFGDELEISYSPAQPIDGVFVDFRYSVWLSCKEHKEWTFETISDLMLKDAIARNVKKLNKLKEKIALLQNILFESTEHSCESISNVVNLAPAALHSFQFLDECIIDRNSQAADFLTRVNQA
ncbi:uncharacterized protein ACA1_119730 [Acanthamoeba castellanii str. Neff]|uniref:Uncharacterized protein n=1 Tax=Acanthamoeba castellanii (strain ATCC 30010 / Neff) TaxID=1257118 RepID=L8H0P4_ACACF|nr:uncharacterized protein ACA1_119730 [Acanthamoeba castellanii str. Neff]ELR18343.1 hypothetical protein ACA1_119730 [Acanthamoeba castellanii str. Neff]